MMEKRNFIQIEGIESVQKTKKQSRLSRYV